jgi:uncharacterized Ntn-hydrolase superfamily protein
VTFSIVAFEESSGEVGVAVASKFLAVGAVVPFARSGVGAIATQALANVAYGPEGLVLLAEGVPPAAVVQRLTAKDPGRDVRQLGVVDCRGDAATYTGAACFDWAGGTSGPCYAIQGNILRGAGVVEEMEATFLAAGGALADRLLAALAAGDAAGGDRRGRQSAAIVVRQAGAGYGGGSDLKLELRVDDHPDPVRELERLQAVHELLHGHTAEVDWRAIDEPLAAELRSHLAALGESPGRGPGFDEALEAALLRVVGAENLEERWYGGDRIDPVVVQHVAALARGR